jgi:hypothetical protein
VLKNKASLLILLAPALLSVSCVKQVVVVKYSSIPFMEWKGGTDLEFTGSTLFTVTFPDGSPCESKETTLVATLHEGNPGSYKATCKVAEQEGYSYNFTYQITAGGKADAASRVDGSGGGTVPCKNCKNPPAKPDVHPPSAKALAAPIGIHCTNGNNGSSITVDADPGATQGSTVTWALYGPDSPVTITFDPPTACPFDATTLSCPANGPASQTPYAYKVTWDACNKNATGSGKLTIK